MRVVIAVVLTMFSFSAAWATVYEWVDSEGVVHMTDDSDKVPLKYRKVMKAREMDTREVATPPPPPAGQTVGVPVPPPVQAESYGGHGEEWWHTSFKAIRDELELLRGKLPEKKELLTQLHRRWVISMGKTPGKGESTNDPNSYVTDSALSTPGQHREAYYKLKDEIEKDEARIPELDQQLAALEARANWFGVPAGWRQ